ncbi:MAG: UDP-3-O-(3-hydroxymyristoyl)glucosamine N-acyltransferase [Spirochaetota bacterium]|nr:UDP-3-O-(3-hydroxymyristoyl)glucosamine N-acyltransferase [Spirochaetota bacterium]
MKLSIIAEILNENYYGEDVDIHRVGSLDTEYENAIIYVEEERYLDKALSKNPVAIILPHGLVPEDIPYIAVTDTKLAFIRLLELFPMRREYLGIDKNAHIHSSAHIGDNVTIMTGAVIMEDVEINDNSVIYPNCTIEGGARIGRNSTLYSGVIIGEECVIGDYCIIHSGTVIGSDGYGFYEKDGKIIKIPQIGSVKIGNNVEVGANCCIDRATVDITEIGNDTKLDNMVHIAHNVKIGERCLIIAQTGISGSVTIGNHVTIFGQAGIGDHISIADETIIIGQSGIHNDIKKPEVLFGTPARPHREQQKIQAAMKYLPELLKRMKRLERKIRETSDDSQDSNN